MDERDEIVITLDDITYILRPFDVEKDIIIKDRSFATDIATGKRNFLLGTYQFLTVLYSLASWSVKDKAGNPIPITEKNLLKHLKKEHLDKLSVICEKLNHSSEEEKKTSSEQQPGLSDGENEIMSEKKD